ncbi:MAG: hypothetical protein JNM56_10010 [Planctomycetia bacterium]|nr:hypothetical protein [Planctomycetia bacterium]
MKGFIAKTLTTACLAGGFSLLTGCYGYRDLVDPCYPWRYAWQAEQSVCTARSAQINNGHVLDQTIWNWHFELGTDRLNAAGRDKLNTLARRRPHPDPVIYLATAGSDPTSGDLNATADNMAEERNKRNDARIAAIQKYLAAQTDGRGLAFQVYVHDPAEPYLNAGAMGRSIAGRNASFQGSTGGGGGGGGASGGN